MPPPEAQDYLFQRQQDHAQLVCGCISFIASGAPLFAVRDAVNGSDFDLTAPELCDHGSNAIDRTRRPEGFRSTTIVWRKQVTGLQATAQLPRNWHRRIDHNDVGTCNIPNEIIQEGIVRASQDDRVRALLEHRSEIAFDE